MREPSEASGSPSSQSGVSETGGAPPRAPHPTVETVEERGTEGYESDESSQGGRSRASSTFSAPDATFDLREYVDLSEPGAFCMMRMTRVVKGHRYPAVCGNLHGECKRSKHAVRNTDPSYLAPLGLYLACPDEYDQPGTDGRTDSIHYSREQVKDLLRRQEREREQEREEASEALSPERRPSTTVTFAATPISHRTRQSTQEVIEIQDPTPSLESSGHGATPPRRAAMVIGAVPPNDPPPPPAPRPWYGLVRPSGQRVATNSAKQAMEWQYAGDRLERIFASRAEAEAWVAQASAPTSQATGPTGALGKEVLGPMGPDRVLPPEAGWSSPSSAVPPDPMSHMLARLSTMPTGPDPSTGTELIFGLDPTHETEMDGMLLPPHLTDSDQRKEFFNISMDVTSLPGGYRSTDDDDQGGTEALMHVLGHGGSTFRAWRKTSLNALAKIKSKDELLVFVRDVEKVVVRHRLAEHQRWRNYMHKSNHTRDVIELYLRTGLLPRLIDDTYQYYINLLNTVRSSMWEFNEDVWAGSYTSQILRHHSLELQQIRQTASDYRMFLLEVYVYLRNANKEKFQDPSFTRALLYNTGRELRTEDPPPPPAPNGAATSAVARCAHCRRNGTHQGVTKEDCPLKVLSARKAQSAVTGLSKVQARTVTRAIASAFHANPAGDVDAMIATARTAV